MKKITLCLMLILALIIVPGVIFAAEETAEVDTYEELVDAIADSSKTEIIITDTIEISESVTINGQNKIVKTENGVKSSFKINNTGDEVINVTFKDITITNPSAESRCINTRTDKINLTLDNVKLQTTSAQNNQPLTIGGTETGGLTVKMINSSATSAGTAGYGLITFVPADITIENSSITGYAALYVKSGSAGLKVDVINSSLIGENNNTGSDDSFGTIIVEDSNVTINVNKNSTIKSTGKGQQLILGDISTGSVGNKINISSATIDANGEFAYVGNTKTELSVGVGVTSNVEISTDYLPEGAALEPKYDEDYNIIGWGITERTIKVEGLENVLDAKEAEKILLDSLDKYFKDNPEEAEQYKHSNMIIEVEVFELTSDIVDIMPLRLWETFVDTLKGKDKNATMTKRFVDIYCYAGDMGMGFDLTELVKPLTFEISLPENLPDLADGYERVFYVVRQHANFADNGAVTHDYSVIDAKPTDDGKALLMSTDQFSLFGIGYADVEKTVVTPPAGDEGNKDETTVTPPASSEGKGETDKVEDKVEDKKEDANIENSETGDNVLVFAGLAIVSIAGLGIVTKKYLVKK